MTDDVQRHETLFVEVAGKFEKQKSNTNNLGGEIEKLHDNARAIDFHLSDIIPYQVAAISFEVGKGLL